MNRKILIIIAVLVMLICVTVGFGFEKDIPGSDVANDIASELKDSATALIESGNGDAMALMNNSVVIEVEGEPFTKNYFDYRIALYRASGSETPEEDALELIKKEGYCYSFAKEHDLMPSEEELIAEITNRRAVVESSEESHELAKVYFESMGLTEDEYWNVLTLKYEVPGMITRYNVEKYLEEQKLPEINSDLINYVIVDEVYFEDLGLMTDELM